MNGLGRISNRKIWVGLAVLAVGVAIFIAAMPMADAVIGPYLCTYYKDATYRKAVGARGTGCCGEPISWGTTSAYKRCDTLLCADVVCPN